MKAWKIGLLFGVLLVLSSCTDMGAQMNRLYGLDCRPEVLKQNGGYCGATAKGL